MSTVLVEQAAPRVKLLRPNRPERLNAMSVELCLDLEAALDEVGRDNDCSVLGASWLLPRLIGAANANDILLAGRGIDAREALRMGLVSRVVADADVVAEAVRRRDLFGRRE